jgi:colanic acid/amylovoran biosynthesis glycosyltransferase
MAAAIVSLAEHPESWSRMGRAGRAHVEEHFDRDKLQEQLIRLYQGLCGQPAPGDSL